MIFLTDYFAFFTVERKLKSLMQSTNWVVKVVEDTSNHPICFECYLNYPQPWALEEGPGGEGLRPTEISWGKAEELQGIFKRCPTASNMDENRAVMNSKPTQTNLEKTSRPGIQLLVKSVPHLMWEECGFSGWWLIGKESFYLS